ncbi:MAG TPA: hypothetical protein VFB45_12240 [Pseudolabrys sp.]|nr:hypothetical protein [Pseudolabrys sp.]
MIATAFGGAFALPPAATAQDQVTTAPTPDVRPRRATTRIYVYPRREPGPNSKRICQSWLAREYRVSGPVIVPQMRCWWD